jgi:hypothetical protein
MQPEPEPDTTRTNNFVLGRMTILAMAIGIVSVVAVPGFIRPANRALEATQESRAVPASIPSNRVLETPSSRPMLALPKPTQQDAWQPWCTGTESICTTTTTAKPAAMLNMLAAAIPPGTAKQYRVRLSVTAVDESGDATDKSHGSFR